MSDLFGGMNTEKDVEELIRLSKFGDDDLVMLFCADNKVYGILDFEDDPFMVKEYSLKENITKLCYHETDVYCVIDGTNIEGLSSGQRFKHRTAVVDMKSYKGDFYIADHIDIWKAKPFSDGKKKLFTGASDFTIHSMDFFNDKLYANSFDTLYDALRDVPVKHFEDDITCVCATPDNLLVSGDFDGVYDGLTGKLFGFKDEIVSEVFYHPEKGVLADLCESAGVSSYVDVNDKVVFEWFSFVEGLTFVPAKYLARNFKEVILNE